MVADTVAGADRGAAALESTVTRAIEAACRIEVRALKPGNVHIYSDGHGMTADDFLNSARAAAGPLGKAGLTVGERILGAITETWEVVGCNTNLGIVLLCAPLAQAALTGVGEGGLEARLGRVLNGLTVRDAELAYAAIRRAAPAGLGRSPDHDVGAPPTVTLRAAMAAAADRDRIARQYVTGFKDVFALGVPRIAEARARWARQTADALEWAATAAYLAFLSRFPDTHIARKYSTAMAERVRRQAQVLEKDFRNCDYPDEMKARLLDFDTALKAEKINPGTSADLTVASLLATHLVDILARQTASE